MKTISLNDCVLNSRVPMYYPMVCKAGELLSVIEPHTIDMFVIEEAFISFVSELRCHNSIYLIKNVDKEHKLISRESLPKIIYFIETFCVNGYYYHLFAQSKLQIFSRTINVSSMNTFIKDLFTQIVGDEDDVLFLDTNCFEFYLYRLFNNNPSAYPINMVELIELGKYTDEDAKTNINNLFTMQQTLF